MDDQRRVSSTSLVGALGRRLRRVITIGLLAGLAGLVLQSSASASASPSTKLVPGYLDNLPLATLLGTVPSATVMSIGVGVQRPDTASELALYSEMYNPQSSQYHHFLTPAQFTQRFGVQPATTAAVRNWLTDGGLTIGTSTGGDYFTASGTVAQLEKLFKVTIGSYTYKGEHFIANDAPPSVPADLPIDGVTGLDNVHSFTLDSLHGKSLSKAELTTMRREMATAARPATTVRPATTAASPAAGDPQAGDELEFTPQELWGIYNDPGATALTNANGTSTATTLEKSRESLGQGQTMGIFGDGESSSVVAQLRLFETAMGLPKVPVRTIETEGGPGSAYGDNTGSVEWYLDSQSSTGIAPDASQLDFFFAKSLYDPDIYQAFNYWANDATGPRDMNASFGECEENPTNPLTGPLSQLPYGTEFGDELEAMAEPILRQATMEGRTLFSSAGDTGSGCPEIVIPVLGAGNGIVIQPVPAVSYPCDSAYVVCVGGTVVSADGTTYPSAAHRIAETSWTYGGGGTSYYLARPSYQDGVTQIDSDCISTPAGKLYPLGTQPCRGVPDVADLSGNSSGGDGYFIYIDGEPSSEGGTSLASPVMMGQWTRIQAAASSAVQKAGGLGFADPLIYRQAASADSCSTAPCTGTYARDFFDVTQSENDLGNGVYRPGAGWDYASGWGAINVANFTQDVDGSTTAPTAAAPETPAVDETTATMTSPAGNATDPIVVTLGNVPSLDLTQATLTDLSGKTITATLTGPRLGSAPPSEATAGNSFFVTWEYDRTVYYARADESLTGAFTYSSGNTGTYGKPSTYGYNDTSPTAATGSVDTATGTITINVPASEVGSPPMGASLTVPQAFDQLDVGSSLLLSLNMTTDSSDNLTPVLSDDGASVSKGVDVVVGGVQAASVGPTAKECMTTRRPTTHVKTKRLGSRKLYLTGVASTRSCGPVASVGVAIARVAGHRCRFLNARGRFGKAISCQPKLYLRAKGTAKWSFSRKVRLSHGIYHIWARAINAKGLAEKNTARKFIFLRLR